MLATFSALALVWLGCSSPEPRIEGRVVDIWGAPIQGATVMVEGGRERPLTDAQGRYTIERMEGLHTVKAGRRGYVQEHQRIRIDPEAVDVSGPTFTLYPQPDDFGLYLVQHEDYGRLEPIRVFTVGTSVEAYRGIRRPAEVVAESPQPRVLWHTDLPPEDVVRLGLELRKLEYVPEAELTAGMGRRQVGVNLYTDAGAVPTELTPLESRSDYLVAPREELSPGVYAFQTQDLLTDPEGTAWAQLPPELRVVHAFTVR